MKSFDAVIFDMDGVIFDSEKLVVECWMRVAEKYGIEDVENTCRRCMGLTREATREIFKERYGHAFPYDDYKQETRELFFAQKLPVKKGVVELFDALKEAGKKIALASSTRSEAVIMELKDAGLFEYFDVIMCGDMVTKSKPDPEIWLKACERLGVLPENSYGIEDSHNGVRSVYAAGMHAIMVPDMLEATDEMRRLCEAVLGSLIEVREYLL